MEHAKIILFLSYYSQDSTHATTCSFKWDALQSSLSRYMWIQGQVFSWNENPAQKQWDGEFLECWRHTGRWLWRLSKGEQRKGLDPRDSGGEKKGVARGCYCKIWSQWKALSNGQHDLADVILTINTGSCLQF